MNSNRWIHIFDISCVRLASTSCNHLMCPAYLPQKLIFLKVNGSTEYLSAWYPVKTCFGNDINESKTCQYTGKMCDVLVEPFQAHGDQGLGDGIETFHARGKDLASGMILLEME